jgi:glutamate/tyrosine decarboxylase-like PLP-dependent enzyme
MVQAARYLDIEERWLPVTEDRLTLDPQKAIDMADENTMCALQMRI